MTEHPRTPELLAAARALRDSVRVRLARERTRLAGLEQDGRALEDEIALMERSAGRRVFLAARSAGVDAIAAAAHPAWAIRVAAHAAASYEPLSTAVVALRHLRRHAMPLRFFTPVEEGSLASFEAVRWVGPVSVRRQVYEALLCHPVSRVAYRMRVRAGSRFATACTISPHVWAHRPGPVVFRVRVEAAESGWQASREAVVDSRRLIDRIWHPLTIDLPAAGGPLDVTVTLETDLGSGADGSYAWALFGEPRFEWRRPASEIRRSLAAFSDRARTAGLREAIAAARRAPSAEEAATMYARWVDATTPTREQLTALAAEVATLPHQPLISVLTPVYNTDPRWLRAAVASVRQQAYPHWEHILVDDGSTSPATVAALGQIEADPRLRVIKLPANAGISMASNAALAEARGEFVALLDHDDELSANALAEVVRWINDHPDTDVVYSDEDKLEHDGTRCDAFFKPDWSPEHFLHCMYTCHLFVARRALVQEVGGFRKGYEGAQDYDLMLRLTERTTRIGHIPRVLYHWRKTYESTASAQSAKPWAGDAGRRALDDCVRRRNLDADVLPGGAMGLFRVKRRIAGEPLVSIIIPTAGRLSNVRGVPTDLVAETVCSIVRNTAYGNYEFVVIADEPGLQPSTVRALEGTRHRVLTHHAAGPFNFSRKINQGAAAAAGQHLLLCNDDLEAIDADWLSAMLEYSQDPAIGAVGAKLMYPDGRLQHVGMILGVSGIAAHAFHQHPGGVSGYFGSVIGPRNYSAVTAACLMTRQSVFAEVGGFDETFPIDFNDVDYCLRVRRAGYRIVYTPYARLLHHESASFGPRRQDPGGIAEMKRRWANELERDPYYNPHLTREFADYRLKPPLER